MKRISHLVTEAESALESLLLSWRKQLRQYEHLTPQTSASVEEYHTAVGIYGAYEVALEIVEQYAPRTKQALRGPIRDALSMERVRATAQYHQATTDAEQWQAEAREAALWGILAEWVA